jgi:hypothetical protein
MSHMLPHRCFTMHWISLAAHHYPFPVPMPSQSKVKQYQDHEVDFSVLSDRAFEVFGKRPFRWQLEAAQAILCGRDVVLGTGVRPSTKPAKLTAVLTGVGSGCNGVRKMSRDAVCGVRAGVW